MMEDHEPAQAGGSVRIVRLVLPWVALLAILWALTGYMSEFSRSAASMAASTASTGTTASVAATATGSVTTTVTDLTATMRANVLMRAQASSSSSVVATAKIGTVLNIVARQNAWLRVRDKAGHVGWIPNNSKLVTVKAKTK